MKIQTMLLPTGKYALVISEAPENILESAEVLVDFREQTGAVAGVVLPYEVEVVDALVDDNAVWTEPEPDPGSIDWEAVWKSVGYTADDDEAWTNIGHLDEDSHGFLSEPDGRTFGDDVSDLAKLSLPESHTIELDFTIDPDKQLLDLLYGGVEFSPAGLVLGQKSTADLEPELGRALADGDLTGAIPPEIFEPLTPTEAYKSGRFFVTGCSGVTEIVQLPQDLKDLVGTFDPSDKEASSNLQHPGEYGRSPYFGPQTIEIEDFVVGGDEEWSLEPEPFLPGTRVAVIGRTHYGIHDVVGQVGTVIENEVGNTPEGCVLVDGLKDNLGGLTLFVPTSSLQIVPAELPTLTADELDFQSLIDWVSDLLGDGNTIVRSVD